jgi:hypothetical protein
MPRLPSDPITDYRGAHERRHPSCCIDLQSIHEYQYYTRLLLALWAKKGA